MSAVVLDQAAAEKLRECQQVTVLRDPEGRIIGYFEPRSLHVYQEGEIPEFDEDELDRREVRRDVLTSAEVRRRLDSRQ